MINSMDTVDSATKSHVSLSIFLIFKLSEPKSESLNKTQDFSIFITLVKIVIKY